MTAKVQIFQLIDHVSDPDMEIILSMIRRLADIDPDDIASLDDLEAHRQAMEDYRNGVSVRHEDMDWT